MTNPAQIGLSVAADLERRLQASDYDGYAYAYPHKSAYRPLSPPVPLKELWAKEDRSRLFLYTHLPFCEVRCGFCNLFTTVRPERGFVDQTLDAIVDQAGAVAEATQAEGVSQAAFGGGTPSFLSSSEIERIFTELALRWPVDWHAIPVSFEASPATLDPDKLAVLRGLGVDRLSMGVQSFVPSELKDLGRPQRPADVDRACAQILDASFPTFNLDLIYGARTQTPESWARSVRRAVAVGPQEIYLYPLYVRALTGLSRVDREPSRHRRALYRVGRDLLLDAGYEQVSMRYFRRATSRAGADYCCQEDGMVGLGPGARSYTRALHYSSEYAVGQVGTKRITAAFNVRERHDVADFGFELDEDEQRRRYLIKSLLRRPGLSAGDYVARFGTSYAADFPGVKEALLARGLAREEGPHLELTDEGFELSDTLGPWLYSASVQSLMVAQELS